MARQFSVIIEDVKARKKTSVINKLCEVSGLSSRKAKELVESKGAVAKSISKSKAEEFRRELEAVGAFVEVVPDVFRKEERKTPTKNIDFKELNNRVGQKVIADVAIDLLKKKKIRTLEDIRRNGGIRDINGMDEKVAKTLEAHAYISVLSDDTKVNQKLIDKGFLGINDIAELAEASFFREAEKLGIKKETAFLLYSKAVAASAVLTNVLTQVRVEQANGFAVEAPFDIEEFFPLQCACPDSESAVSPLAYLADLLDYTMRHVQIKREGEPEFEDISLDDLEQRFHQPFGRLPTSSNEVERRVRQVRVCIEVLRRYLAANPISSEKQQDLTIKEKEYAFEAYKALLNQIGTSFEELRLTRTAGPDRQAALTDRLGIGLRDNGSDPLDELLLAHEEINEQILERLFGLIDTTRDPLCDGIKSEDTDERIEHWNFMGAEWNRNTDADGNIYGDIRVTNIPSDEGLVYQVNLYSDRERTQRVASGEGTLGTFELSEKNHSGLSARIQIEQEPQNNRFEISVIPSFLAWRLKHLRTLWKEQEGPSDPITEGRLPVIDPDVIGPEDLRNPEPGLLLSAFGFWEKRRDWIDEELQVLAGLTRSVEDAEGNPVETPDFEAMFQRMYEAVTYEHEEPPVTPWKTSTSTTEFNSLLDLLRQGTSDEAEPARARIEQDLNLRPESFVRLMELREKSLSRERKTSDEPVTKEEWQEVYSILVQVEKQALISVWCKEERSLEQDELSGVLFGPKHFWISLRQPTEGPWSPALHDQRPLIDPEIVTLEDLVADPIGQPARSVWNQRQELLALVARNIRRCYEEAIDGKLEAALRQALGQPPGSFTWIEVIEQVDQDLKSLDEETRKAAEQQVRGQFWTSLEDFAHLVTVKSRPEPPQDELDKAFQILTSAHKRKSLYQGWAQEEETANLTYWRVLKPRLPLWRASLEGRVRWQYALRQCSRAPIIDPNLTDDSDFKNPYPDDDPAFCLWVERSEWVNSQLTQIRSAREAARYSTWGDQGSADGRFFRPQGIAVDGDGNIYVADTRNERIQKFDAAGEFVAKWGGYPGSGPGEFKRPSGVAVDGQGYLYVADTGNNRIQKLDSEGTYVLDWGDSGSGPSEFELPTAVALNTDGNVYVVDTRNHRIQRFTENGEFRREWGEPGDNPGQFLDPLGIAVDPDGNVYVADTGNHRIQKFDSEGTFLSEWGGYGSAEGQFNTPAAVAVDGRGHIYVSDSLNHRVQEFDVDGHFIRPWRAPDDAAQQFSDPCGLAVAPSGHVHVTDADIHKIHKLDRTEGLAAILEPVLGVSLIDLTKLAQERSSGNDITTRLDQLCLSVDVFAYLMRIAEVVTSGSEVMQSEWEEVYPILVQAAKRKTFADWRVAERAHGITLSPDFFVIAEKMTWELKKWLATREDRWDWEDRVSARIDQEKTTISALAEAVDACEEATLTLLRDALIEAGYPNQTDNAAAELTEKAKYLGERLLIDCQISPCQKTTRVSQALTTLQNLAFSLRTGQLEQPTGNEGGEILRLDPQYEHFNEEWMWMGSYETWKAALGVFLYPENLLLPRLRYQATPAFRSLLNSLQANRRLTPIMARTLATEYADYLYDVCNLQVQASCTVETTVEGQPRRHFYMFALGEKSSQIYWCFLLPSMHLTKTEIFWDVVPVSDVEGVVKIIAATPFRISENEQYVFLFLSKRQRRTTELTVIKYDLLKRRWVDDQLSLESPHQSSEFTAVVKQTNNTDRSPHVIFRLLDGTIYERYLNEDGDDWAEGEWIPLVGKRKGMEFSEILGCCEVGANGDSCLIAGADGEFCYRLFGEKDDGSWRKIDAGKYLGGFGETQAGQWFVFDDGTSVVYKKLESIGLAETSLVEGLEAFNNWLIDNCGIGLQEYYIAVSWYYAGEWKHFFNLYDLLMEPLPEGDDPQAKNELQRLQERAIDTFIEEIKNADYLDERLGDWRLACDYVRELTLPSNPLEDVLFLIRHFDRPVQFKKRAEDQLSAGVQLSDPVVSMAPTWGIRSGVGERFVFTYEEAYEGSSRENYCCLFNPQQAVTTELFGQRIAPIVRKLLEISDEVSSDDLQRNRRNVSRWAVEDNSDLQNTAEVVKEAFYFVPVTIALQLQRSGHYASALDWLRSAYDYTLEVDKRKIYYGLKEEEQHETGYERADNWLLDPLDVHAIASTRRNAYTRFTLLTIIRCLIAYADAEFTRDTAESIVKAGTLYETATDLLRLPELNQQFGVCKDIIGYLTIELDDAQWQGAWSRILKAMGDIGGVSRLNDTIEKVQQIMGGTAELSGRIALAKEAVNQAATDRRDLTIREVLDSRRTLLSDLTKRLLEYESVERGLAGVKVLEGTGQGALSISGESAAIAQPAVGLHGHIVNTVTLGFCIPPNPMINALRSHAANNIYKLRTCRNIAGIKREIETYAAPTDILSAITAIGPGGQLIVPMRITPPPVPYRYEFLIERAKQLANMAAQIEGAFLAALEKRDIELYNRLKAKQDLQLARAGVKLQNLRLRQARDEVKLAELQRESAQIQAETYHEWLDAGLNQWEWQMISAYHTGAVASVLATHFGAVAQINQAAAAAHPWGVGAMAVATAAAMAQVGASEVAIMARTMAEVAAVWATYERRAQEWQLQRELAQHAMRIGDQQIRIANDGVGIVRQEGEIARIQVEHAEAAAEFLQNKFTSAELYDWMSGVLEGVYNFFLHHATSMARLAQNQLAFERQEPPPAFIQNDYWEVPSEERMGGATEEAVDRHGLTGSARLLGDIYKLDQYRLDTEKRKLQLAKNISLSRVAPYEFQRFRETGVMVFATPMELFDRDFPGHYLRMIRRVRTSVVALIPPTQGIKATLSNVGVSRIVIDNNGLYQTITVQRPPESVALCSPANATGVFELETQQEMLLPFEGLGVDTIWEFRMPKAANQFDYSTIGDVMITIEYTALDSPDYRQQIVDTLPSVVSAERPFSFRHQFADQWYDLHNPDQTATPMAVRFRTRREDFPPNIERLKIDQVLLYFAGAREETIEIKATLSFKSDGKEPALGGEATAVDGMISTRRGAWPLLLGASVVGEWTLALPDTPEIRTLFKDEKIEDILFVITYSGRTPEWPV